MLHEICCDQFHQKRIAFNPGLSVVLGTNTGDNSIGKSTFLLIVDYVFGGSTYASTTDIIDNVGPHDIYFSFVFDKETFKFCRNSIRANTVWKCNDSYEKVEEIGLNDYCKWLDSKYAISLPELSFRDAVGRYIRAYGKNNCDERHPLHYDEPLANTNDDLFETPCYSIENLYAQESVLGRILQSEFGLNFMDFDHQKCLADYRLRLNEFNQIIAKFNAVVKYQHQYAPGIICQFSKVKTSHLAHIEIAQVTKSLRHDAQIDKLVSKLNADTEILKTLEDEILSESSPDLVLRGKNQLDFLVSIIMKLKELNDSGGYFSRKLEKVYITLSANRLSELSQYAITPPELESFLKRHKLQVNS